MEGTEGTSCWDKGRKGITGIGYTNENSYSLMSALGRQRWKFSRNYINDSASIILKNLYVLKGHSIIMMYWEGFKGTNYMTTVMWLGK